MSREKKKKTDAWIVVPLLFASLAVSFVDCEQTVQVFTYGDPCMEVRRLPYAIEYPKQAENAECEVAVLPPAKMRYKVIAMKPSAESAKHEEALEERYRKLPIGIQVPKVTSAVPLSKECDGSGAYLVDRFRGKSYRYNVDVPQDVVRDETSASSRAYKFELEVPPAAPRNCASFLENLRSTKTLTGLKSRIDRLLVPACEVEEAKTHGCSSCDS